MNIIGLIEEKIDTYEFKPVPKINSNRRNIKDYFRENPMHGDNFLKGLRQIQYNNKIATKWKIISKGESWY